MPLPSAPSDTPSADSASPPPFEVQLEVFSGPLDLLLSLIIKHRLDITEVALAQVTDEFINYLQTHPDLSQVSEFLVVAATLLDIKATYLLPGETLSAEDSEYLEARDLLFARLLQYRAFKEVAAQIGQQWEANQQYFPRQVTLEPKFAQLVPQLKTSLTASDLVWRAAEAFNRKPPDLSVRHLHHPQASLLEQAQILVELLTATPRTSFTELIQSATNQTEVVTRFLALLELYRQQTVDFRQEDALGELIVEFNAQAPPDFSQFSAESS